MTTPTAAHPFETLLEQISGRLGVVNAFGTKAEAAVPDFERMVWVPRKLGLAKRPDWQPNDGEAIHGRAVAFDVSIWCPDFLQLLARWEAFVAWVDIIFGPASGDPGSADGTIRATPGYEIGDLVDPVGMPDAAQGWSGTIPVTLKGAIVRLYFPAGPPVAQVPVDADAADNIDDTAHETGASITVTS